MIDEKKPVVLELKNIVKSFGENKVLQGIHLTVREGEFVTLLGSSGCGKTTTLRMIAGLESPDEGEILIEGKPVNHLAPEKRSVNTIFQSYALFPHMNVYQNIAYGLKIRGTSKAEMKKRVSEMLTLVQLEGFEKRMPSEMSGGQRQRVAIARALINNPKVLLLDEPLGALDLQLRRQMQQELKHLQTRLGLTFIYITHDQEEAMNMSDVIAVMNQGRFEQIGTPAQIYDHPKTSYVASFVGTANILKGTVEAVEDQVVWLRHPAGKMCCMAGTNSIHEGDILNVAVRSENVSAWQAAKSPCSLSGTIIEKSFAGGVLKITAELVTGEKVILTRQGMNFDYQTGDAIFLEWEPQQAILVDMEA